MPCQGWRQWLAGILVPPAIRFGGAGGRDFLPQAAHFLVLGDAQALDLFFERPDTGHLADIGGHSPKQQVSSYVESTRRDVALVSLGLHLFGSRQRLTKVVHHAGAHLLVGPHQGLACGLVANSVLAG